MSASQNQLVLGATALTAPGIGLGAPDAAMSARIAEPARWAPEHTVSSRLWRIRPVGELTLRRLSIDAVVEVWMRIDAATALAGSGVDPSDQLGGKEAKRHAFALGPSGFEALRAEVANAHGLDPTYVR